MKKLKIVLAVASFVFLYACGGDATTSDDASNSEVEVVEASMKVSGNCGMCKERIEKAATAADGVESAVWDKETKKLTVTVDAYSKTALQAIKKVEGEAFLVKEISSGSVAS